MKNFLVYKSSAGSGKTTTLVNEYLKITLVNPGAFRHVLAVTFTNKAANELKNRILDILRELSNGALDEDMEAHLALATGLSGVELKDRADRLLSLILHQYDEFAVSTIDSFVHQLVRAFANDLKLPQGFEVVIDEDELIPFILESLYEQVGNNPSLTEILTRYVLSQIEEDKAYDPTRNLTEFIKKQLKEEGFDEVKKLTALSPSDFTEIIKKLQSSLQTIRGKMQKIAGNALQLITDNGLEAGNFHYGSKGVPGYLTKIQDGSAFQKTEGLKVNTYVQQAIDADKWYGKSVTASVQSVMDALAPELRNLITQLMELGKAYTTRRLVYQNIYELALIREIQRVFKVFTDQTQKVHISEFNKRIHEEIAGQPVPFIYERTGYRYRHFLIDEFQDTSVLQWKNLLPLLEESLANGQFNMVVGDAKQAIYRFRNGEMELFARLPELYPPAETPEDIQRQSVLEAQYNEKQLNVNYRSREEIIGFNNRFFDSVSFVLGEDFASVYADHEQELPPKKKEGGWVSIEFMEYSQKEEISEHRLMKIEETVRELTAKNYPLRDICVLTRTNSTGLEIASHLLSVGIPVLSSDSLKLTAAPSVRTVVAFLGLISEGTNQLALVEFLSAYLPDRRRQNELTDLFLQARQETDYLQWVTERLAPELPKRHQLMQYSVFEMALEGIRHIVQPDHTDLFLQFFLDFVQQKKTVYHSLEEFLLLWQDKSSSLSLVMPEGQDAVQVMTAHKAKGLKFGVVIADLYQYKNDLTKDQLWVPVDFQETEKLDRALLKIASPLELIGLGNVFEYEKNKSQLDYLNLVYVAFTRPVDGLHILCHSREKQGDQFSKLVKQVLQNQGIWEDGTNRYSFGEVNEFPVAAQESQPLEETDELQFVTGPWYEHMVLAPVEESYWEALGKTTPRVYGNLVHDMLSKIKHSTDIDRVVAEYSTSGLVDQEESVQIRSLLEKVVHHPQVSLFFREGSIIKTETELRDSETNRILRPDRVVIADNTLTLLDYKTGEKKPEHTKQMEGYASVFARLGYHEIQKLLIYLNEEVEVVVV
ncbi:MAG: UvrD-helicase domain-containing protein [Bacteroidales bacterium]|nr:UvrD-helicase domain-containing protein [Bacteroidales bacterium]